MNGDGDISAGDLPVHWVIQANQGDASTVRQLLGAVEENHQLAHLVSLEKGLNIPPIPDLPDMGPVVCYGPSFIPRALKSARLQTGLYFNPLSFSWTAFRSGWGEDSMISQDSQVMSLADARERLQREGSAFIRPNADSKRFDGAVYDSKSYGAATANIAESTEFVVVSSPVSINAEWRFFIVDNEVVGCSEYRRWGLPSTEGAVPNRAIQFAAEAALRWSPAPIYCLDLASSGDRIGIVEANCFNGSRFYSANIGHIVRAVSGYALRLFAN